MFTWYEMRRGNLISDRTIQRSSVIFSVLSLSMLFHCSVEKATAQQMYREGWHVVTQQQVLPEKKEHSLAYRVMKKGTVLYTTNEKVSSMRFSPLPCFFKVRGTS